MIAPVVRFAPSPNGRLHLGHALSALLNFDIARASGGRLLLRIEDIDTTRCTPELEEGIYDDLKWLGLTWEHPVRRQSDHFCDYRLALSRLDAMGLVYRAYLTRREIKQAVETAESRTGRSWPRDPDGAPHYPGDASILSASERQERADTEAPFALRLDMAKAVARMERSNLSWREEDETGVSHILANPTTWGDVVLARKETPTSYHLSVVVDDALQGVTHVVRGRDLYQATSVHRLLQTLLDVDAPIYRHHRLILDETGRKLSKSKGDTELRALRDAGWTAQDVRAHIGLPARHE